MADTPSSAEPNLGLLLYIPYRHLEAAVMAALRAQGHDLTLSQARVFQRIAPEGSRLGDLAEAAQVPKQTVGSIIDQLQAAGYVQRSPDPEDARARIVRIAPRGQELVELSLPVLHDVEAAWRAHLGPARTRQLKEALTALREITDPYLRPQP